MLFPLEARRRRLAAAPAIILALVLGGWLRAAAQEPAPVTVPITLHGVHIFLEATINHQPVTLVLDTGAAADVVTPQAAARLQLTPGKDKVSVVGAGGAGPPASQVTIGELGVGTARLTNQTAYLIPLPDAMLCDGLLGTPFLKEWIVTIDYEHSRMALTPRKAFTPPADADVFPLRFPHNTPHIEAKADGLPGWFQIDTGAGDAITLFRPFVEKNHLHGKYSPALEMMTGRGVGGTLSGELIRLPDLTIGSFRLDKPIVELSQQTQGVFADKEIAGNLGGEVWQRFTLSLDYKGRKVYLLRNSLYASPFIGNRSGLGLDDEQGKLVVMSVLPNSPGDEAGVKVGDTILAIDSKPTAQLKFWEVHDLLRHDPGTRVQLRLHRTDQTEKEVTLTLRDLL